jgi:hypothetical protein
MPHPIMFDDDEPGPAGVLRARDEGRELLGASFRLVATKRLVKLLEER